MGRSGRLRRAGRLLEEMFGSAPNWRVAVEKRPTRTKVSTPVWSGQEGPAASTWGPLCQEFWWLCRPLSSPMLPCCGLPSLPFPFWGEQGWKAFSIGVSELCTGASRMPVEQESLYSLRKIGLLDNISPQSGVDSFWYSDVKVTRTYWKRIKLFRKAQRS